MNKKLTIIAIIIIGLLAAAGVYIALGNNSDKDDEPTQYTQQSTEAEPGSEKVADDMDSSKSPGSYVTYSDTIIAESSGTKLLFFHAPWCPQCRAIESDIESDGVPDGVTVIKVDYDTNQALRQKYGITLQTTFVKVDDSGNLIQKFVAYNEPTFDSVKQNML